LVVTEAGARERKRRGGGEKEREEKDTARGWIAESSPMVVYQSSSGTRFAAFPILRRSSRALSAQAARYQKLAARFKNLQPHSNTRTLSTYSENGYARRDATCRYQ